MNTLEEREISCCILLQDMYSIVVHALGASYRINWNWRQMWMNAIRAQELSKHVVRVHDSLYVQPPARTQTDKCIVSLSKYVTEIFQLYEVAIFHEIRPNCRHSCLLNGNMKHFAKNVTVRVRVLLSINLFVWLLSSTVWNWYIRLQLSWVGASPVGLCLSKKIESELRYRETSDNPNNEEPQHTHQLSTLSEVWLGVRVKGWVNLW